MTPMEHHRQMRTKNIKLALLIGGIVLAITFTVFASRGVFG